MAAAAQGGGGGGRGSNDPACVYCAVAAGQPEEQVRQLIEQCGLEKKRVRAVNARIAREDGSSETPLLAAHRLARGDLVGALLENDANAKQLGPDAHPLAIAIHYGLVSTLRELLQQGHDPDEELRALRDPTPPPQLECLELLVREHNANVDGRDGARRTPLSWLSDAALDHRERALDLLLSLGADVNARISIGRTPIFWCKKQRDTPLVRMLLARGASANVVDEDGFTPLTWACYGVYDDDVCPEMISTVLRASSLQSRHTRRAHCHRSALELLIDHSDRRVRPWLLGTIRELLDGGVPLSPEHAAKVLPIASRYGYQLSARVAACARRPINWRGHEGMVKLAFDFRDAREAEERVRATERRVPELEQELHELGVRTESDEGEEKETLEEGAGGKEGEGGSKKGGGDEDDDDDDDDGPWW